jgi:glyceraldehyde-3-phosphate dehydrogenase/erythrose-4-phosphate dehydrogenase
MAMVQRYPPARTSLREYAAGADWSGFTSAVSLHMKTLRRARASSVSLIPTSTGSATAIGLIYPELPGKLSGIAVRVPLLNASLTDCVFEVQRPTTVDEVNAAFKRAAEVRARQAQGGSSLPVHGESLVPRQFSIRHAHLTRCERRLC